MAVEFKGAIQFINHNGSDFQKNYFKFLFDVGNLEVTLKYLADFQNKDGGWFGIDPDYEGKSSSVVCTINAMGKFERLGVCAGKVFDDSISYLKRAQKDTGRWDESIEVLDSLPPAWYYPKTKINQIWITNGVLRYFISRKPEEKDLITKARAFLRKFWDGTCFPGEYEHNNWLGIVSFHDAEIDLDRDIYNGCMNNLKKEIKVNDLADVCWAMESLMYLNISNEDYIIQESLRRLDGGQADDGGFTTKYGSAHRVETTIEALDTMAHYDQAVRQQVHALIKGE